MKFQFKNKKGYWFEVKGNSIVFRRPYRTESYGLYTGEAAGIKNFKDAQSVFNWHHYYGMQHRRRHPLGLNLYDLTCEHANNWRKVGQPYFDPPPFEKFYAESKRYAERDDQILYEDGSLGEKGIGHDDR